MKSSALLAFTGLFTIASATPVAPAHPVPLPQVEALKARQSEGNSTAPCARVSQAVYGNNQGPATSQVPAGIAYECITSIPLNKTSAHRLLNALPAYIEWQSTLTTLKSPPAEYAEKVQPPIDILGGLKKIAADIDADRFTSEYDFGWTLYTLIQSAHDGHFAYVPDSVGGIFNWGRKVPLVSVSVDGKQLPAIFTFEDVLGLQFKNVSYTPSPIVEIDGVSAEEFLEDLSQYGSLQDRDALYNNVFYELAQISLGTQGGGTGMFTGGGRGRWVYPGANTKFKFANGTEVMIENYARVLQSFRGISTGEDLAKQWFFYGSGTQAQTMAKEEDRVQNVASAQDAGSTAVVPGYPDPIVAGPASLINGFYVDAPGYEDVAVLQVPNFVGIETAEVGFQKVTRDFIPKALADGKTKLIIDLQANGGGTILQGYDMFKQLFPDLDPYGANRFRAIEAIDLIGQSFSAFASQFPRVFGRNGTITRTQGSYFDYHTDMTVEGKTFSSWKEKFGPHEVNGDYFTTLNRWNLSDVYIPYNSGGINVTGYGPLANVTGPAKFKPENIVLLTDGYCASTCTIFAEFMTKQAGVKTIAMGGRKNKNPIQAIGGVKGTNNFQWAYIQNLAAIAIQVASGEMKTKLNSSILRTEYYNDIVYNRAATQPGVNVRDGLLYNDTSGVALQFIYEEADCRLYYTPEMTVSATAMWTAVADAQWGNKGNCVGGTATYGEKREVHDVTTKLRPRRAQLSKAVAMKQAKAFEDTFSLETLSNMKGDGFMRP